MQRRYLGRLALVGCAVALGYSVFAASSTTVYLPVLVRELQPTPTLTPQPTATLTPEPTPTPSPTTTEEPTATQEPTATLEPTATDRPTPRPTEQLPPTCDANEPAPQEGAQAWVTKTSPPQNSDETVCARLIVNGVPQNNVGVHLTVHYKSKDSFYDGVTATQGTAAITFGIGRASAGYTVVVDVRFDTGQRASTSFTPN
jgi:hypothetical protein